MQTSQVVNVIKKMKINWEKLVFLAVLLTLVFSMIFVTVLLIKALTNPEEAHLLARTKGDYGLMLLQCFLGIAAMFLPALLEHRINISIPSKMLIAYVLFLYGAIYLGEVRNFYFIIPHWDSILHGFSGGMLGALGYSVVIILNKQDKIPMSLSPAFVAFFSFCFAITMGVIWEIYEFTVDGLLGLNMQKFLLENGSPLVGREALRDTMFDLIVDCIGALVVSMFGYISLKYKKGWVDRLLLRRKNKDLLK